MWFQRILKRVGTCAQCGNAGFELCGGCHLTTYCSKRCQTLHWDDTTHQVECHYIQQIGGPNEPKKKKSKFSKLPKDVFQYMETFLKSGDWRALRHTNKTLTEKLQNVFNRFIQNTTWHVVSENNLRERLLGEGLPQLVRKIDYHGEITKNVVEWLATRIENQKLWELTLRQAVPRAVNINSIVVSMQFSSNFRYLNLASGNLYFWETKLKTSLESPSVGLKTLILNWSGSPRVEDAFPQNTTLETLVISGIDFTKGGAPIAANKSITELELNSCSIRGDEFVPFVKNTILTSLSLYDNGPFGNMTVYNNLKRLDVSLSHVNDEQIKQLVESSNITQLLVNDNQITDVGTIYLRLSKHLVELHIARNEIRLDGVRELFSSGTLVQLDLSENNIRDDDEISLENNLHLLKLNVSLTGIGPNLSWGIAASPVLHTLHIAGNLIKYMGALFLSYSGTLKILNVSSCELGDEALALLAKNTSFVYLDVQYNDVGEKTLKALIQNTTLRTLYINHSGLMNLNGILEQELIDNENITFIDIRPNE